MMMMAVGPIFMSLMELMTNRVLLCRIVLVNSKDVASLRLLGLLSIDDKNETIANFSSFSTKHFICIILMMHK